MLAGYSDGILKGIFPWNKLHSPKTINVFYNEFENVYCLLLLSIQIVY